MVEYIYNHPHTLEAASFRVILLLGSLGIYGEINGQRLLEMPLEADLTNRIRPGDNFTMAPENNTTRYLADWVVTGPDVSEATSRAIIITEALRLALKLNGLEIKAGRRSVFHADDWPDTNTIWESRDTEDITPFVHATLQDYHASQHNIQP